MVKKGSNIVELIFDRDIIEIKKNKSFENCKVEKNKLIFKIGKRLELIKCMHICTDIISDSFADKPLLKTLKPEGEIGEYIIKSFDKPHYQKVRQTYINTINIKIYDHNFNFIRFNRGPIIIKLHFQKRK